MSTRLGRVSTDRGRVDPCVFVAILADLRPGSTPRRGAAVVEFKIFVDSDVSASFFIVLFGGDFCGTMKYMPDLATQYIESMFTFPLSCM